MKLYFMRHGLAGERSEWKGNDAARPLTDEGIEKMKLIAATLSQMSLGLDAIIASPFVRARQTAEIVAQQLEIKLIEDARLAPGFNGEQLDAILRDHPGMNTIMLVGHEPDLSETIGALIGGGRVVCKKGGLALVDLPNAQSREGILEWIVPPKMLVR
jgi:phosphohistidine phosphatase